MPIGKRIVSSTSTPLKQAVDTKIVLPQSAQGPADPENTDKVAEFTLFHAEEPKYNFSDIILNNSTYDAIQDVLSIYEKRELLFDEWGLDITHKQQKRAGINLYGAPGTGKSMAAHAIANRLGRQILTVDYSQIESKYVGETSKNLVAMFNYAKESKVVIFFDEADALLSKRVTDMSSSTDVSVNQTRSVLLVLINDFDDLILFATNFITNYDPAFMRRILGHVKFEMPDDESRLKLWRMYIPQKLPTNADINELAAKFTCISGSDISNAVLAASLRTARLNERNVQHSYFEEAIDRIIRSKADNDNSEVVVSKRTVSEDYVKSQFGGELPKC
jgi:SpoVK/Ycf46/Vps4 family AAA+-type ATPase